MRKIYTLFLLLFAAGVTLQAQIYFEDFEAGFSGWTAENIWKHGNAEDNSSSYFTIPDHGLFMAANDDDGGANSSGDGSLISPPIDLTGIAAPFLICDVYFLDLDYNGADETAKVLVSTDNGTTWTEVKSFSGATEWVSQGVDLSAYGNQTIQIAFEYKDGGEWNYGFAVDNVLIKELKALDVALSKFNANRFLMLNTTVPISIEITNEGSTTINYLEVSWSDGVNTYTDMVNGLSIAPFDTYVHNHSTSFTGGNEVKQYDFTATVSNPNVQTDEDMTNNVALKSVSFIETAPAKVVVGEEATGTWCPWCPRGEVFLNQMIDTYPDQFIGIAVHNSDPMANAEYDSYMGDFEGFPGYPSVIVGRNTVVDPSDMPNIMAAQLNRLSPVSVEGSGNYIDATGELNINIDITSYTEIRDGQLPVSVVIVEDGMRGTGSNWAQANAYAGGGNGPMGGYESLPNPVPAAQMVYNHVGRELPLSYLGDPARFPATMLNGDTERVSLTYDVPAGINVREMHVVVMVTDPVTGEIYNAGQFRPGGIYPLFESASQRGCGPFEVQFTDPSDSTDTWAWNFEGGTPATSTEQNPTVTFNNPGTFNVTLTAVTNTGNTYNIELDDYIKVDEQSTSDFDFVIENDIVKFDNNSSNAFNYTWDLGDGTTTGSPNPQYQYAASGVYTVCLTARNGTCEDVYCEDVTYIISGLEDVLQNEWNLSASPNPFKDRVAINYDLGTDADRSQLVVYNYLGQELLTRDLNNTSGTIELGEELSQGVFFVQIRMDQKISKVLKVTKVK